MQITYLGELYDVRTAGQALEMMQRLAGGVSGITRDLGLISTDVAVTKARVDRQTDALQWIGQRLQPGAVTAGAGAGGLGAAAPLAILAGLGLNNGPTTPSVPAITPGQPALPAGTSAHRDTSKPPTVSGVDPNISNLQLAPQSSDRTHVWLFTVSGNNIGPGAPIFQVTFGAGAYAAVPVIQMQEYTVIPGGIIPINQTVSGYLVTSQAVLQNGQSYVISVVTTPTTENFD